MHVFRQIDNWFLTPSQPQSYSTGKNIKQNPEDTPCMSSNLAVLGNTIKLSRAVLAISVTS